MSRLFVVATPIGNLEDVSARARRVLSEVGAIAAEDTRITARLLARHEIRKPMISYRAPVERRGLPRVMAALAATRFGLLLFIPRVRQVGDDPIGQRLRDLVLFVRRRKRRGQAF